MGVGSVFGLKPGVGANDCLTNQADDPAPIGPVGKGRRQDDLHKARRQSAPIMRVNRPLDALNV
jgi:hypothetical protein